VGDPTGRGRKWTFTLVRPVDASEDGGEAFVSGMPRRLEAAVAEEGRRGRGRSPSLRLVLDVRSLPPVVTAITAQDGLRAELLRSLPLSRLAKYATVVGFAAFGKGPLRHDLRSRLSGDRSGFSGVGEEPDLAPPFVTFSVDDEAAAQQTVADSMSDLMEQRDRESNRRRRNVVTDELLERVAGVYRQATEARRPPQKAVQLAENVSPATAGRYIQRARERGYLAKATRGTKHQSRG
jgi:hypothetical protein